MSVHQADTQSKVTVNTLLDMKKRGEKISMLTAYDYSMAKIVDGAGCDMILIGDSASNVICGNSSTLPITIDEMIFLAKNVVRGVKRAFVSVDMPFGTCSGNPEKSLECAIKMIKNTGADSVKIEGGEELIEDIRKIINAGIPVVGHLGLMPQSINKYGGYSVRAKGDAEAEKLMSDAHLLEQAGCCALVLEKIPAVLAQKVAESLTIPVIGIGAGSGVDGQVLVFHDMLGINQGFSPKFLRKYANIGEVATNAIQQYIKDVKSVDFPNKEEQY